MVVQKFCGSPTDWINFTKTFEAKRKMRGVLLSRQSHGSPPVSSKIYRKKM